jgi:glycerol-3-phosphate dehydrogenase
MRSFLGRGPLPERVDIVILGGGINGVALARECAQAHKSVLLVERHDFASGTTSRCSRIVHGGLHYLENGEFGLLRESLRGRENLLREQPHLVQPLDFVLAVGPKSRYSGPAIGMALWLYRKLGRAPVVDTGIDIGAEVQSLRQSLDPAQRWAMYSYQDARCDFPERLVADWLVDACAAGTFARNHSDLLAIRTSEGRVRGVMLRDTLSEKESYVECEWVINATGPWVDLVRDTSGLSAGSPLASGLRCTHIMLRPWVGAPTVGLHATTKRGRPISIAPWNGMLQVGSTETANGADPAQAVPSKQEVEFLLTSAASLFPEANLTSADVVFSYSGVRPLPYSSNPLSTSRLGSMAFRSVVHNHADEGALGMLSVFGGTLTTASSLARNTARMMGLSLEQTSGPQIAYGMASGVENTLQQWASAVHASTGIPQGSAEAIARWHGRHAMCVIQTAMHNPLMRIPIVDGHPYLVAQAVEAVAYEHAVTLADILLRRVPMALTQDWNEESTAQAADRIAPALQWGEHRKKEEMEAFEEERNGFLHKTQNLKPATTVAA